MARRCFIIAILCLSALPVEAQPGAEGWSPVSHVEFKEHHPLSNYTAMCRRCRVQPEKGFSPGYQYDLKKERFGVYVPDVDDANAPFGLIVWITMGGPNLPGSYPKIFDKHRLISVGVDDSGNRSEPCVYHRAFGRRTRGQYWLFSLSGCVQRRDIHHWGELLGANHAPGKETKILAGHAA